MSLRTYHDITPRNGWRFAVTSRTVNYASAFTDYRPSSQKETTLVVETAYSGSRAVEIAVQNRAKQIDEHERFVEVDFFPQMLIIGSHRHTMGRYKRLIQPLLDQAKQEEKGLILGFSVWQGQQTLDTFDLLDFVRSKSEGEAVCVVGGPSLSDRNPELEADLFAAGADIINIGGAAEFSEWLSNLKPEHRFERDQDGKLHVALPLDAPFFSALSDKNMERKGKPVEIPIYFDLTNASIDVTVPGIWCANRCGFCSIDPGQHKHDSSQFHKIPKMAQRVQKLLQGKREYASRRFSRLAFNNPNILQRPKALQTFYSEIDLSLVSLISHFGEAPSFRKSSGVEQHLAYIDGLLNHNAKLTMNMTLSLDAIQYENDNDFLHKTVGAHILQEEDCAAIVENYTSFLTEVSKREWRDRLSIGTNLIAHPGMTAEVYLRKQALVREIRESFQKVRGTSYAGLHPYEGSPIARDWENHYAPMHLMEKQWMSGYTVPSDRMSHWGNQFKNGDLFDCFMLSRTICSQFDVPQLSYLMGELLLHWDGTKAKDTKAENLFYHPDDVKISHYERAYLKEVAVAILESKGPRVVGLLDHFLQQIDNITPEKAKKASKPAFLFNGIVNWIKRRETYLMEHHKDYAQNPYCAFLVDSMNEMAERFKPFKPYMNAHDERPRRRASLQSAFKP